MVLLHDNRCEENNPDAAFTPVLQPQEDFSRLNNYLDYFSVSTSVIMLAKLTLIVRIGSVKLQHQFS